MSYESYDDDESVLEGHSRESAKRMLGTIGDAMEARIERSLNQANQLLNLGYAGASIVQTATGGELFIRFMVLRPLVASAFLSEVWESILTEKIGTGRSIEDRRILPDVLAEWGIDVKTIQAKSNVNVWDFFRKHLWNDRDNFVHKGIEPEKEIASTALECVKFFKETIVEKIGTKLGFTLEATGKWCEIKKTDHSGRVMFPEKFEPWDTIAGGRFTFFGTDAGPFPPPPPPRWQFLKLEIVR